MGERGETRQPRGRMRQNSDLGIKGGIGAPQGYFGKKRIGGINKTEFVSPDRVKQSSKIGDEFLQDTTSKLVMYASAEPMAEDLTNEDQVGDDSSMDVPRRKDPEKSSRYSSKRFNKNAVRGSKIGKQSSAASANFGQSNLSGQEDDEFDDDRSSLHGLYHGHNPNEFSNQLLAKQQSNGGEGDVHMYVPPVAIDSESLFNNDNGSTPASLTRKDRAMSQDKVITVRQLENS